ATVTDLCRSFGHKPFRLDDHLRRFRKSCDLARVPLGKSDDELRGIVQELLARNTPLLSPAQDLALVLLATPGPIGYSAGQPGAGPPTLALHTFPLPFSRYARFFEEGVRLAVPSTRAVPSSVIDPRIKHRSRLHWWIAQQEVHDRDP